MSAPAPPPSFLEAAAGLHLAFEEGDLERLGAFLARLLEANRTMNLTAIRDLESAWTRHVLDALTLLPYLEGAATAIDVGAGGGVPGLPLAIVRPDIAWTLLEATGKKARFLEATARDLGLENVTVVAERAETAGRAGAAHRERHDAVTARAVGPLPVLLELAVPLARVGGLVLAIKGARAEEEIVEAKAALHALHAAVIAVDRTPTGTIVAVEKRRTTPKLYPRRPGEPKRNPL